LPVGFDEVPKAQEIVRLESQLKLGECTKVMKQIPDDSVDCIITDPPYNLGLFMHKRNTNLGKMRENQFAYAGWDNLEYGKWRRSMSRFLSQCGRVLKKRGTLIIFMAVIKVSDIIELAEKAGFYYKTTGVWHKTNPMPRNMNLQFVNSTECWLYFVNKGTTGTFNNHGKVKHDFLESSVCPISEKRYGKHPTQKPLSILRELIESVTDPDDMVLDPFMGSGSTCVAAAELGRRYYGIELDEEYHKIAVQRINEINAK
jgi:DNA modification methylase